jgi:hypothetical protein
MQPNSIEDIISGAASGGWDWFEKASPEAMARRLKVTQERDADDGRVIAAAWARFYNSEDGRMALDRLFDTTLRRAVYFANLEIDMQAMAVYGALREGQNSLAHEIARQISIGQADEEGPKPRDT